MVLWKYVISVVIIFSFTFIYANGSLDTLISTQDAEDFKECKTQEYFGLFSYIGTFHAEIKKQSNDDCFIIIMFEEELGWNKVFCKVQVGQIEIFKLVEATYPLAESLPIGCYEIARGNPNAYSVFFSPRMQTKLGVDSMDVTCSQGMVLLEKNSDNSVACVKPTTAKKLIEQSWGKLIEKN